MSREKYETCRNSTGDIGELIVYAENTCPKADMINGWLVSSKIRCRECEHWERKWDSNPRFDFEEEKHE